MKLILTLFLIFRISITDAQFFTKITNSPISTTPADSRSVNWVDVNNDGLVDCFISNGPAGGQNDFLYINNGSGNFTAVTSDSIVLDNKPSDGATFGDMNNDGAIDAFVVNWYNVNNMFYVNNGAGQFTKVNSQIISNDAGFSETAAWGDYDKDGLLDLYVTNSAGNLKNFLYHNNGNTTFSKIASGSPVTDAYVSRCVNWTDIDMDGDLDLFVSNESSQPENIYRNDGNGIFAKLSGGPLLTNGGNTMSSSWGDYDNDGDLDVFLANDLGYNSLFRNDGNFTFMKIIGDTVGTIPSRSFSSAWSDIDNDGDLDLFVTNSFATGTKLVNFLYINNGNGSFSRNSSDVVAQDSSWSYGCAFGDYDNDGFEDLAVATCRYGGIDVPDYLYHNNGNSNNWITLNLVGTISNTSAIGTKIKVKAVINGAAVWQMREISSQSSYCGQNDMRAHFGLGNATAIDSIIIEWPLGLVEYYTNVPFNQFITYVEGATVGIKETEFVNELSVHPNPSTNNIIVSLKDKPFIKGDIIQIFNMEGKEVYSSKINSSMENLNINAERNNINKGVYLLKVKTGNKNYSGKIIIH